MWCDDVNCTVMLCIQNISCPFVDFKFLDAFAVKLLLTNWWYWMYSCFKRLPETFSLLKQHINYMHLMPYAWVHCVFDLLTDQLTYSPNDWPTGRLMDCWSRDTNDWLKCSVFFNSVCVCERERPVIVDHTIRARQFR